MRASEAMRREKLTLERNVSSPSTYVTLSVRCRKYTSSDLDSLPLRQTIKMVNSVLMQCHQQCF